MVSNTRSACFVLVALAILLGGCASSEKGSTEKAPDAKVAEEQAKAAPKAPDKRTATLKAGTTIKIRTTTTLSTETSKSGEAFTGSLAEPLVVDGETIAAKGALVKGQIVDSDPGGRVKGRASLTLRLTALSVEGKEVAIHTGSITRQA